jgi:hypothetical protein
MKRTRTIALSTVALALLAAANLANAQQYPPVWTDILNLTNESNMASGNYYDAGGSQAPILNTDLAGILPTANTLSMPQTHLPGTGGAVNCGNTTNFPVAFIESNQGTGVTGVGFLGTFNTPYPLNNLTGNLFESVFFNTNQCYNGGREYGFFLATYDSSIWAYWGTNENLSSVVQGQLQLNAANNVLGNGVTIQSNTEYYFEMYPVLGAYGSCAFEIAVYTASNTTQPVFAAAPPITAYGATNILTADPSFCTGIASATGYVSANIEPASASISGTLPTSGLYLNMQRVFVGKD